jgi:hypothetical protein
MIWYCDLNQTVKGINMDIVIGVVLIFISLALSVVLYKKLRQNKSLENMLKFNRAAMRKIMNQPHTIFWVRIVIGDEDPVPMPVVASENGSGSGFAALLCDAISGEITICEEPIEHDPGYRGANGTWMKERAFKYLNGECPVLAQRFLPNRSVLNSMVPTSCTDRGVTIWSPSPEEKPVEPDPPPRAKITTPDSPEEAPRSKGVTLFLGSERSGPTLFDKQTLPLLPGTGSEVVQVNETTRPVLVPRTQKKGGGKPPEEGGNK